MPTSRFLLFAVLVCAFFCAGNFCGRLVASEPRQLDSLLADCGNDDYLVRETARKELFELFIEAESEGAEGSKPETAKSDIPNLETAKSDNPKSETANLDNLKQETAKPDIPKLETANLDNPNLETAKSDNPKSETANLDNPKSEEKTVWLARRLTDSTLDSETFLVVLQLFNSLTEERQKRIISEIPVPEYSPQQLDEWSKQCVRGNCADSCRAAFSLWGAANNPSWSPVLVVRLNSILESGIGFWNSYQILVQAQSRARTVWLNQDPIPEFPISDADINSAVDDYLPVFDMLLTQRKSIQPLSALSNGLPRFAPVQDRTVKRQEKSVATGFRPLDSQQKEAWFYDLLIQPTHRERIKNYLSVLSQQDENRKPNKNSDSLPVELPNLLNPKSAPAGNSDDAGIPVQTDSEIPDLPVLTDPKIPALNQDAAPSKNAEADDNQNLPARLLVHIDELFKPGLVTEYWQSGVRLSEQYLIVGQPRKEVGALRPSYFDKADSQWAHCASGNNLTQGNYRVGIAFPHPNQLKAFFRIVYLPDLQSKLLYTQDKYYNDSNSLAAVSRITYNYYLERQTPLSRHELLMIQDLDCQATLNFFEQFVRTVPDQVYKEPIFNKSGSLHGHLSVMLAMSNVPGAAEAILKADREKRFLPLDDSTKNYYPAVAVLSLCSRNHDAAHRKILTDLLSDRRRLYYGETKDQNASQNDDSKKTSVLTVIPSIDATAQGILRTKYHVFIRDVEISEVIDPFYSQFGLNVWGRLRP